MRIFQNIDVKVKLEQSIEGVAVSNNDLLRADLVFVFSVNIDRVVGLVVSSNIARILAVLVHNLRVCTHHSDDESLVVLCGDVVPCEVHASVVVHLGHVVGFVGAGSGNLHAVEKWEATGELACVGDEIVLSLDPE